MAGGEGQGNRGVIFSYYGWVGQHRIGKGPLPPLPLCTRMRDPSFGAPDLIPAWAKVAVEPRIKRTWAEGTLSCETLAPVMFTNGKCSCFFSHNFAGTERRLPSAEVDFEYIFSEIVNASSHQSIL